MEGLMRGLRAVRGAGGEPDRKAAVLQRVRQRAETEARSLVREARGDAAARRRLEAYVRNVLAREALEPKHTRELAAEIAAELAGLGPIDPFLGDERVSEIMVNGPEQVYVEREGRLVRVAARFESPEHVIATVQRLIAPLGRRLDAGRPFVDARLPDGSRLHAVIPPIALHGPVVTIRRFGRGALSAQRLRREGTWSPGLCAFLIRCVRTRLNLLISGGTSAGKTTLLNVLASLVPRDERLVTIEEAAELQIRHPHVVSLEGRGANHEGRGEVTLRALVRNALRMRPDRILVGEVRGPEALELAQALNTGHAGSLSTLHANSARDALSRLELMMLTAPDGVPHELVSRLIRTTVDVIVHMVRRGPRRLVQQVWVRDADAAHGYAPVFEARDGGWSRQPLPAWLSRLWGGAPDA